MSEGKKFIKKMRNMRTPRSTLPFPHSIPRFQPLISLIQNRKFRFWGFITIYSSAYIYSLHRARQSENEILRIGAAGSITMLLGETSFYFIDAINTRTKILTENVSFPKMLKSILKSEGISGLFKGYSASFYSSIMYGYMYFYLYKGLKVYLKDQLQPQSTSSFAAIYASASTIAEFLALIMYYPYELVKVRLLTKNDVYNYYSVSDAFLKILRKDSVPGLYKGVFAFFLTFMGQYTIQMTCYEMIIDHSIRCVGLEKFQQSENFYVIKASLTSGFLAALFTNFLEVIVVRQQSESGQTVAQIFKQEGFKLFTKGLFAKLLLTSCSSMLFFMSMNHIGKLFNTNLSEEKE